MTIDIAWVPVIFGASVVILVGAVVLPIVYWWRNRP